MLEDDIILFDELHKEYKQIKDKREKLRLRILKQIDEGKHEIAGYNVSKRTTVNHIVSYKKLLSENSELANKCSTERYSTYLTVNKI